jgi:hypothetical protein
MEIEESKGDFSYLERETKMDDIEFASELQFEEVIQQSKFQSIEELQCTSLAKEKELQKIAENEAIALSLQEQELMRQRQADALEAHRLYLLELQAQSDGEFAKALA